MLISKKIKGQLIRSIDRWRTYQLCKPYRVKLYNWCTPVLQDFWLPQFIEGKNIFKDKKVGIFSVFDPPFFIKFIKCDYKIFLARENVHREQWRKYEGLCINNPEINLSIGFDYNIKKENYIRFPLWIMWLFKPQSTYSDIKKMCEHINNSPFIGYDNKRFCSFICSHNDIGRKQIYQTISQIDKVDCPGKLFHNDDSLYQKYNNNKLEYLKGFRFNLCPENSNYEGYCTEKIFEAFYSGCIPIYNGTNNNPEPDIINKNSIVFFEFKSDNNDEALINNIRNINNKSAYMDFIQSPKLLPFAADRIWQYYEDLESKLREIIY